MIEDSQNETILNDIELNSPEFRQKFPVLFIFVSVKVVRFKKTRNETSMHAPAISTINSTSVTIKIVEIRLYIPLFHRDLEWSRGD